MLMKILPNYPLSQETTFLCGGRAKWFCAVLNLQEFENLLKFHKGKFFILGGGSKTLCKDEGYDGLVISTKHLNKIGFDGNLIVCEAGAKLSALKEFCVKNGLSGLEWSAGIPASVGGATVMNAGSFGKDFGEFVENVEIFEAGQRKILNKSQITFSYRNSSLKGKVVLRVWLKLNNIAPENVKKSYEYYFNKKTAAQPTSYGSAGSIFKRSENVIPAKIIDKLGLKGVKIGGAEISTHHSGFIINTGTATATDVLKLIDLIKKTTLEKCGKHLQNEIIVLE